MPLPDSPLCEHGRTERDGCVRCEEPIPYIMIHQRCAESGDVLLKEEPLTRRAWEVEQAERRDEEGIPPINQRRAWWCNRCGERVKQDDVVVGVRIRS